MAFKTRRDIEVWAKNKWWPFYAVVGFVATIWLVTIILGAYPYVTFPIVLVNIGIHELAHIITSPLPEIVTAMSGSLFEILLPLLFAVYLFKRKEYFIAGVVGVWLMFSFYEVALYVSDAIEQALNLSSLQPPFEAGIAISHIHDWNYVLSKLGILSASQNVASGLRIVGFALGASALGWLFYLCLRVYAVNNSLKKSK